MSFLLKEFSQFTINEESLKEFREADQSGKPIVLKGIIQRADAKNQNGRIYPYKVLKKECDRYMEDFCKRGLALGELDHEDSPVIQLKNVSHIVENLWWDGPEQKEVHGSVRLLNTPAGKIAKDLVLDGIPIGISSRAVGSLSKNEGHDDADVVSEDLNLICWDLVATPSTHEAYLKLHESKEIKNFDARKILPPEYRIRQALEELLKK